MSEIIIPKPITEELKTSYLTYALSVIVARALPDVRDGLKPVHRRILYAMYRLGMFHNRAYKKCATVVGEVLGKYHPHGDQAIYETLVRLAQDFSMRHVLIDGQGNFGSMDGDNAAAMRYTESRLTRLAGEMLQNIDKETIDFQNNFDDTLKEPTILPACFPNLIVNGGSGIAVGMATNIPPHNLKETMDAVVYYLDNRDTTTLSDIMQFIKGPDFPTGGIIHGISGIQSGYKNGKGIFKIRGKVEFEQAKDQIEKIVIIEMPYQVNKAELIKKIALLVKNEVVKDISEIRDESDKDGVRVVIEIKKNAHAQIILNQLYKHTQLEESFGINNVVIVDGTPKTVSLLEMIHYFIAHRFITQKRRITFELKKAEARHHIVLGLIKAVNNIEEVVKLIKESVDTASARVNLVKRFDLSTMQADAILDMRLARIVALEIKKLEEELKTLSQFIAECKELLAHPEKIYAIIKDELLEIKKNYGNERRTEILSDTIESLEAEAYIQKDNMVVSMTKSGFIKSIPSDTYTKQNRGGVGIRGTFQSEDVEENLVSLLFVATTHDITMFITNLGKAYYLKVHEIPQRSRTGKGIHSRMLLNLSVKEEIQGYITFRDFSESHLFLMATRRGIVKKCNIQDFINAKKRGIQAIKLRTDDTLVNAVSVLPNQDIMLFSAKGLAVRTSGEHFRKMGRTASGVKGINLDNKDKLIAVQKVDNNKDILIISERGMGKRLSFSRFSAKGRGTKGQISMKTTKQTGQVAVVISVLKNENVLIISSRGNIIRLSSDNISTLGRTAKGPKLVNLKENDFVIDAAVIQEIE